MDSRLGLHAFGFSIILMGTNVQADLSELSDMHLADIHAQAIPQNLPILSSAETFTNGDIGFDVDLNTQANLDDIVLSDENGWSLDGSEGIAGTMSLNGVYIGSIDDDIQPWQVRENNPFNKNQTALIKGLSVQGNSETGSIISINQLGQDDGTGFDFIINDIYFGQDLSAQGEHGLGLLMENVSNHVSHEYLDNINGLFNLNLALGNGTFADNGRFYPIKFAMTPLEGGGIDLGLDGFSQFGDLVGLPGFGENSMVLDAEFLLYMKKLAIYRNDFEMGIEGLLIYDGKDTNADGIEDTIGPVQISALTMQTKPHTLPGGKQIKAMHISNINVNLDIAMSNVYIGNSQTGSLGALHINDLNISNTELLIYPKP